MNRVLYQLSYAAMCGQRDLGTAEISFVIISGKLRFVKRNMRIISENFGKNPFEVVL